MLSELPSRFNSTLKVEIGECLFDLGELAESKEAFLEVIKLNSASCAGYCQLGRCLYFLGDTSGARSAYQQALEISPDDISVHIHYYLLLINHGIHTGDFSGAEKLCRMAIKRSEYASTCNKFWWHRTEKTKMAKKFMFKANLTSLDAWKKWGTKMVLVAHLNWHSEP